MFVFSLVISVRQGMNLQKEKWRILLRTTVKIQVSPTLSNVIKTDIYVSIKKQEYVYTNKSITTRDLSECETNINTD